MEPWKTAEPIDSRSQSWKLCQWKQWKLLSLSHYILFTFYSDSILFFVILFLLLFSLPFSIFLLSFSLSLSLHSSPLIFSIFFFYFSLSSLPLLFPFSSLFSLLLLLLSSHIFYLVSLFFFFDFLFSFQVPSGPWSWCRVVSCSSGTRRSRSSWRLTGSTCSPGMAPKSQKSQIQVSRWHEALKSLNKGWHHPISYFDRIQYNTSNICVLRFFQHFFFTNLSSTNILLLIILLHVIQKLYWVIQKL